MKIPEIPASIQTPDYLSSLSGVLEFILSVETLIETPYDTKSGDVVAERISDLIYLFAGSTKAISSARYYRDETLKYVYEEMLRKAALNDELAIKAFKTPSVINKIAETRVAELNALLVYVERINAAITHSIDGLRSILSNLKAERQVTSYHH